MCESREASLGTQVPARLQGRLRRLASILFLVGISTHVPYRGVRCGLIGLGIGLLVLSLVQLSRLPLPPSTANPLGSS